MGLAMSVPQLLIILVIVALIFGTKAGVGPRVSGNSNDLTLATHATGLILWNAGGSILGSFDPAEGLVLSLGARLTGTLTLGKVVGSPRAGMLSYDADKHIRLYDGAAWWQLDRQTATGAAGGDQPGVRPSSVVRIQRIC